MATLRTDFTDRTWDGNQKYEMINNDDGTVSFEDVTEYENDELSLLSAGDINSITGQLNAMNSVLEITLSSSGWTADTSAGTYSQTVSCDITEDDNPLLVSALEDGASSTTQKAYNKAFSIISAGTAVTAEGSVTFTVYKLPSSTITVGLRLLTS